jgi:predicted kinase
MRELILIRGLPGSGKSTLAAQLAREKGIAHYEADQYFIIDGEYRFDIKYLSLAHDTCFQNFRHDLDLRRSMIVSNTFTRWHEMRDYVEYAQDSGYKIKVITCLGQFQNIHGVPPNILEKMRARFVPSDELPRLHDVEYIEHIPVAEVANTAVSS